MPRVPNPRTTTPLKRTTVRTQSGLAITSLRLLAKLSPGLAAQAAGRLFFLRPPRRQPTAGEQALLARGRRLDVPTRAGRLVAWTWRDHGPVVLLAHGWAGSGSQLGAFVDPLLAAGCRPVVVDLPGHGVSAGLTTTIPRWADALIDVARHASGVPAVHAVVAHSLGTAATALALERGLRAQRVVLLAPIADPAAYFHGFVSSATSEPSAIDNARRATERRLHISFDELSVTGIASRRQQPLLVVHDAGDREAPLAGGASIAHAWPDGELFATQGLGHRRLLADPGVVARVVAFARAGVDPALCCRTAGCPRLIDTSCPEHDGRCQACALEHELAHPHLRWVLAA